jgi:cytochrome c biogenesis protein CcmG/thiol:disulfide interchange protein DsbE
MPQTRRDWIIVTVVCALLGTIWIGITRVEASEVNPTGRPPSPDIGHPAPEFSLVAADGDTLALDDLKGQPVLINFWATWCPPCRAEIPALEAASQVFDGQAVILGINVQENPDRVVNFMAELDMTYPVVFDEDVAIAQTYRVRAYPTTYFVDARGVIVDIYTGPLNEPLLLARLGELVEE